MSRLTKHLVWTADDTDPAPRELFSLRTAPGQAAERAHTDISMCPREAAVYLLHIGAEVEHALMAQYLYAGYSLGGEHLTPEQKVKVQSWRETIFSIAREEMAHLATVENLLTLIGGALTFEREDFPVPDSLYPFPFELEPLTKRSLGRYVLAEMPGEDVLKTLGLGTEIKAIEDLVGGMGDLKKVHRVGTIYDSIKALFAKTNQPKDPAEGFPLAVAAADLSADSIAFQVRAAEWGIGESDLLIKTATNREEAVVAIKAISDQGEGTSIDSLPSSHFGRFLEIYRHFPDREWQPAKAVARNPTLDPGDPMRQHIGDPAARTWAKLFNLRYRLVLMFLSHSFSLESTAVGASQSPRGLLISWTFGEMYNLRSIAEILMTLPLGGEAKGTFAGPPFEMPYSLALERREADRWRGHRDLIAASNIYIAQLRRLTPPDRHRYLNGLQSANDRALAQIIPMIGA